MRPLHIYIAGPYTAPTPDEVEANVMAADLIARELAAKGHFPFCPHRQSHGWERDGRFGYEDYLRIDLAWLGRCDALFLVGRSPGADREVTEAERLGLAVWTRIEDVPPADEEHEPLFDLMEATASRMLAYDDAMAREHILD